MNRSEFMDELKGMIGELPAQERKEALAYYENYFDDAGEENEAKIIREFGSPGRLAAIIKEEVYGPAKPAEKKRKAETDETSVPHPNPPYEDRVRQAQSDSREKKKRNTERIILIILICIVASPVIIGVVSSVFGILMGIFGAAVGLFFGGIATVISGIILCFTELALGFAVIGTGFLLLGIGFFLLIGVIWICGRLLPSFFRWAGRTIKKISGDGGERA